MVCILNGVTVLTTDLNRRVPRRHALQFYREGLVHGSGYKCGSHGGTKQRAVPIRSTPLMASHRPPPQSNQLRLTIVKIEVGKWRYRLR
jgi:hypothetical protein